MTRAWIRASSSAEKASMDWSALGLTPPKNDGLRSAIPRTLARGERSGNQPSEEEADAKEIDCRRRLVAEGIRDAPHGLVRAPEGLRAGRMRRRSRVTRRD